MTQEELDFLRDFYRAVADRPIEFNGKDDQLYVPLYEEPSSAQSDPVKLLARSINFSAGQSVQLFSGLRGSGKSTELRRLCRYLEASGKYKVLIVDLEQYLNLSQPVEVSEFFIAVAAGIGDALLEGQGLSVSTGLTSYWESLASVLITTSFQLPPAWQTLLASPGTFIERAFKDDPKFLERLRAHTASHLGDLMADVRRYISKCIDKIQIRSAPGTEAVLLLDSLDHIQSSATDTSDVLTSVVRIFIDNSTRLHFDNLHVVYTVPPYLKVLQPNIDALYAPSGVQVLPAPRVHDKESQRPVQPVLDLLEQLISRRGDWRRLLGPEARGTLDELGLLSGGHLRDFLRMFAEISRRAEQLPVPRGVVDSAIQHVRSSLLPVPEEGALWLDQVASSHILVLPVGEAPYELVRYFDRHLVIGYREADGEEWYDVHPLIREHVARQASGAWLSGAAVPEKSLPSQGVAEEMRLTALRVGSFRLLRRAELRLEVPLAVIVGPNQSGKSSVLDALQLISEAARGDLADAVVRRRGGLASLLSRDAADPAVSFEVELRAATHQLLRYRLQLGPVGSYDFAVLQEELAEYSHGNWGPVLSRSGTQVRLAGRSVPLAIPGSRESLLSQLGSTVHPLVQQVRAALASIAVYPYFRTGAAWADPEAIPMRRPARLEPGARLHTTGSNLAAALHTLREERPEDWEDFLRIVRLAFPRMKDLRLPAVSRGTVQLFWVEEGGRSFDASELSDGTLGFLAILCALFQPGSALIAVDEPEAHLHPDALMRLAGAAESLSVRQPILFTTQSDALIGLLDEIPESVVVAQREGDEARLLRPGLEDLREWLKSFSLREMRRELEGWSLEP
jgi:predicted ATPase